MARLSTQKSSVAALCSVALIAQKVKDGMPTNMSAGDRICQTFLAGERRKNARCSALLSAHGVACRFIVSFLPPQARCDRGEGIG